MESIFKLSVMISMIDNMTAPVKDVGKATKDLEKKLNSLDGSFKNMIKSGALLSASSFLVAGSLLSPVAATFETGKALGELASVGVQELGLIEDAAKDFSNEFAGTTKSQFITAAYDIKSGIASLTDEGVADFTKLAGLTAKATKSTTAEMTNLFATGYGIYRDYYNDLSDLEFGVLFSGGISGAVQMYKTTGSEMTEAISSLGATATSAKVPMEEQLAILGMLQATMSGSEAGTKYTAFLNSAAKAGGTLGLNFLDSNKQLRSMPEILEELKSKFGETLDASEKLELQKAFGTEEAVKLIDLLYGKVGTLESGITGLHDKMSAGTKVTEEMASAINNTPSEQFTVLKQKIGNVVEEIGSNMLPTVNEWLEKGGALLEHIADFTEKHGELIANVLLAGAVLAVVVGVIGLGKLAFGAIGGAITGTIKTVRGFNDGMDTLKIYGMYAGDSIKKLGSGVVSFGKKIWLTATTQLPAMISSCWGFTVALLANPITWVVVGVIALIAALVLLWYNWDSVSAWLKNTWDNVVGGVVAGWNWLKGILQETPNWLLGVLAVFMPFIGLPLLIIKNWDTIKEFFSNLWTNIKDGFNNFITNFIPNLLESGKKIMTTIGEGIKSAIMAPVNAVKSGFSKLRNMLPFSDAKEGPLSDLTLSGSRINTTIADGIKLTANAPASEIQESFSNVAKIIDFSDYKNSNQKISLLDNSTETQKVSFSQRENIQSKEQTISKDGNSTQIVLNVDIKDLKDLDTLLKFAEELKAEASKGEEPLEREAV